MVNFNSTGEHQSTSGEVENSTFQTPEHAGKVQRKHWSMVVCLRLVVGRASVIVQCHGHSSSTSTVVFCRWSSSCDILMFDATLKFSSRSTLQGLWCADSFAHRTMVRQPRKGVFGHMACIRAFCCSSVCANGLCRTVHGSLDF